MIRIHAGRLITPLRAIENGAVLIDGSVIVAAGSDHSVPRPDGAEPIEAQGHIVCPGFTDCHIHGGGGHSFVDGTDAARAVAARLPAHGTTSFLATLVGAATLEQLLDAIRAVRAVQRAAPPAAEILGIHLEGPFLSPRMPGANLVANMRTPSVAELQQMFEVSEGSLRIVTIAPELDGALDLIRAATRLGIVVSVGHTDASYEQVEAAVAAGASAATHTFNAMSAFAHRAAGAVGAVLTDDRLWAELIADGVHVGAVAIQVLLRCKGIERVLLVTDNIRWAGLPDGVYGPDERPVIVAGGACRLANGTLAGSAAPMNENVGRMARLAGLREAIQMASFNPCRAVGLAGRKGSLEPGKDADLLVLRDDLSVVLAMNRGRVLLRPPV